MRLDPHEAVSMVLSMLNSGSIGIGTPQDDWAPGPRGSAGEGRSGGGSRRVRTPSPPPSPAQMDPGPRLAWERGSRTKMKYTLPGRRSKGGDHTLGWSRIPTTIFHRIVDYVLRGLESDVPTAVAEWYYPSIGGAPDHDAADLPLFIFLGMKLDDLRLVSEAWRIGVDSHIFWPKYNLNINNGLDTARRSAETLKYEITKRKLFPTQAPGVSHRSLAMHQTKSICIPCRLDRPRRRTTLPANTTRRSTHMGLIRICPVHSGTYCDNCLEVDTAYTFDDQDKFLDSDFEPELKYVQGWDTDENGQARTRCWLCPNCRKSALRYQLKRLLIDKCSREGPLLGMGILSVDDACDTTLAGAEYVSDGLGSASEAAQNMLDQQFLMVQGKWESLERVAYKLQEHEEVIRKRIMRTFKGETPREVEMRNRLLAQMMALTEIDDEWVETIQEEYQELWSSHVRRAMELKSRGLVEVEDEDDYELVLDHRMRKKLRSGAITHFVLSRIRLGFWVSPEDEIAQLATPSDPPTHVSVETSAKTAGHPFEDIIDIDSDNWPDAKIGNDHDGWINLDSKKVQMGVDTFLPTPRLARDLEQAFAVALREILEPALKEVVSDIVSQSANIDEAQRRCAAMELDQLLRHLGREECWYDSESNEEEQEAHVAEGIKTNARDAPLDVEMIEEEDGSEDIKFIGENLASNTGRDFHLLDSEFITLVGDGPVNRTERTRVLTEGSGNVPRIELVLEDQPANDYGIQEVVSSPPPYGLADDDQETTTGQRPIVANYATTIDDEKTSSHTGIPSHLGKRKDAPEEKAGAAKERKSLPSSIEFKHELNSSDRAIKRDSPTTDHVSSPSLDTPEGESRRGSSDTSSGPMLLTPNEEYVPMLPNSLELNQTIKSIEANEVFESLTTSTDSASSSAVPSPQPFKRSHTPCNPPRAKALHTCMEDIPWIPTVPVDQLGPGTQAILKQAWSEATIRLRVCPCTICQRRRKMDAWTAMDGRWSLSSF